MNKKKLLIILAVVLVLLVGGFLIFRSTMQKVFYDPIEKNSLGRSILTYRMSLAKISLEKLDSALQKYYPLVLKDGLYLEDISERQATNNSRPIPMASPWPTVTVMKAGRGIYTYPYNEPFLRMHVEQSTPQNFGKDKETIIKGLNYIVNTDKNLVDPIEKESYKNIEYYSLNSKKIRAGQIISTSEIFFPNEQMIVTIYFFNQNEGKESYKNIEEFKTLKTKFIQAIIDSAI